jgi:hypothetical protein
VGLRHLSWCYLSVKLLPNTGHVTDRLGAYRAAVSTTALYTWGHLCQRHTTDFHGYTIIANKEAWYAAGPLNIEVWSPISEMHHMHSVCVSFKSEAHVWSENIGKLSKVVDSLSMGVHFVCTMPVHCMATSQDCDLFHRVKKVLHSE